MKKSNEPRLLNDFIYKGLRKRIILATVIISLVLASIVYLTNFKQIDDSIADIALDRTERFSLVFTNLLNDPENLDPQAIHNAIIRFSNTRSQNQLGKFIHIVIFDTLGNPITQISKADTDVVKEITKISDENKDKLKSISTAYLQSFKIKNHHHEYIQVPLWNASGKKAAVVEGVFRISDNAINTIWKKTFLTIAFAVGIVLITGLILYPVITQLTKRLAGYSDALLTSNLETIKVLGSAIAKRDSDTDAHNYRVTIYAIHLAKESGLDPLKIQSLIKGSFLHDVGKIGIRDNVLLKPGRLDKAEFDIMKTHVNHGNDIISGADWLSDATCVVLSHHEKFDGSGYPQGLKGNDIPIEARIFAIVDVFDALTSKRPYKEPFSYEKTLEILEESKGSHFDPELLTTFLGISKSLYEKYTGRDDDNLKDDLSDLVTIYFSSGLATLRY